MKRSVAITGPTPAFLRWAIWHPCDVRPLAPYRFPDQTFRHLRGIRELSIARAENRCTDEYCFHPDSAEPKSDLPVDEIRGFQRQEITAVFGGEQPVNDACHACPANAFAQTLPGTVAGCFGFMSTTNFDLQRLLSGHAQPSDETDFDLVDAVQAAAESLHIENELQTQFGDGKIAWHRLWKFKILSAAKLDLVQRIFHTAEKNFAAKEVPQHVTSFIHAVDRCVEHNMVLHVELVPSAYSDGETWTLNPACPECGYEPAIKKRQQKCVGCGRVGGLSAGQKFKVLGLRPYAKLSGIIGLEATQRALDELGRS